jgi:hypothetical protein
MSKKPRTLVLFFMTGCPHCEANKPAWEEAKRSMKGKAEIEEHEARDDETASEGVNSFPTMKLKEGDKEAVLEGKQSSGKEIVEKLEKDLKSKKKGGSRRKRTHRRLRRKLLHRTLRNYVSLR